MKTRSFFRFFLTTCFVLLIQGYALSQEALKITHGPYLTEPGEHAITLAWFTNKNCVSWVEYCGDDNFGTFPIWGGYPEIAKSSRDGLIDANTKKHIILSGDILNWIGNEDRIFSGFLDVSVDHFAKEKPFIFIRGNHETRGPFARNLASYFPHSSGKFYYSFSQGNTRFIILDSGEDKPDSHPVYAGLVDFDNYRDEQTKWLEKEVQSEEFSKAKYKIVLFHIPPYTGSKKHGASDVTKKWGPVLNEANVDLVMSGHRHRYSKIDPQKGKNAFPVLVIGKDMIVKTDVSDKQLLLTITDKSGEVVDQFSIPTKLQ